MRRSKILEIAACVVAIAAATSSPVLAQEAIESGDDSFLSHVTIAAPFVSRHFPKDRNFNDHNWGGAIFYALNSHFSLAGGDFLNSYRRNTAFAAMSVTPWSLDLSAIQITPGALVGIDLNRGYKGYNPVDPLLGAATMRIDTHYFTTPHFQFLNRLGLLIVVIPGFGSNHSTAANLALTMRL